MVSIGTDLAWVTVVVGILLSYGGLRATLYFGKIDQALTGNWVIRGRLRTVRTITIVAVWLTFARVLTLVYGTNDWISTISGLMIIWLLSLPILLWREAVAREGIGEGAGTIDAPDTTEEDD